MTGQSPVPDLSTMPLAQASNLVAAHSIHALAVVVPIVVIIGALYFDRFNRAWRKWMTSHRRRDE